MRIIEFIDISHVRRLRICIALSFAALLPACALLKPDPPPSPYRHLSDAGQIYSIVFDSLLRAPGPGLPGEIVYPRWRGISADERSRKLAAFDDSLRSLPDSLRLQVLIADTTVHQLLWTCPPKNERYAEMDRAQLRDVDAGFVPLICAVDSLERTAASFDIGLIHSRYPYRLCVAARDRSDEKDAPWCRPRVVFSRIAFSADGGEACVWSSMFNGGFDSSERWWFLENSRAGWRLAICLDPSLGKAHRPGD
jgi:hypothetical protein